jgi:thiamine pyrophosphate-dependent acetolactate synthase large subunit-like protein
VPERKPYNPDFAAWAKAADVEGLTVTKSQDFKGTLEHAVKLGKPIPHTEPVFGRKYTPPVDDR